MKILNDFRCSNCGTVQEHWLENDIKRTDCQTCGGVASRIVSGTSFTLEGVSGDFPGAHMKWDKKRAQKQDYERSQGKTPFGQPDH